MTFAHRSVRSARRGLSFLEFLAYFTALSAGVVLGSWYLGVNVEEMAYVALERANIVDAPPTTAEIADAVANSTSPAAESPADLQPSMGADGATATVAAERTLPTAPGAGPTSVHTSAGAVNNESASATAPAVETGPGLDANTASALLGQPAAGLFARADLITPEQRHALTLAYWEALGVQMQREVDGRLPAVDAEGNWQLFDYLTGRKDGHLKAADAIARLDMRGVDDHVLAYAKKARAWHVDGAKLFGRAVDLLTDAPTAQLSGPFAQSWQSAATQHRMEAQLLEDKHQAVQTYLAHAYQTPPTPATNPAAAPTDPLAPVASHAAP